MLCNSEELQHLALGMAILVGQLIVDSKKSTFTRVLSLIKALSYFPIFAQSANSPDKRSSRRLVDAGERPISYSFGEFVVKVSQPHEVSKLFPGMGHYCCYLFRVHLDVIDGENKTPEGDCGGVKLTLLSFHKKLVLQES